MYTEKELNYYVAGHDHELVVHHVRLDRFHAHIHAIALRRPGHAGDDLHRRSPVTVEMGDTTTSNSFVPVTCTGFTSGATDTLTGCTVPAADASDNYASTSLIAAPGAATVPPAHPRPDRRRQHLRRPSCSRTTRT